MAGRDLETGEVFLGNAEGEDGGTVSGDKVFSAGGEPPGLSLLQRSVSLRQKPFPDGFHCVEAGGGFF